MLTMPIKQTTKYQQEIKDTLKSALWLIENVGWCKNRSVKSKGGYPVAYCATGAIDAVTSVQDYVPVHRRLAKAVPGGYLSQHVVAFNDRKSTTKDDIVKMYKKAIRSVEKGR